MCVLRPLSWVQKAWGLRAEQIRRRRGQAGKVGGVHTPASSRKPPGGPGNSATPLSGLKPAFLSFAVRRALGFRSAIFPLGPVCRGPPRGAECGDFFLLGHAARTPVPSVPCLEGTCDFYSPLSNEVICACHLLWGHLHDPF